VVPEQADDMDEEKGMWGRLTLQTPCYLVSSAAIKVQGLHFHHHLLSL
jgi:hypothetical protein